LIGVNDGEKLKQVWEANKKLEERLNVLSGEMRSLRNLNGKLEADLKVCQAELEKAC